MYITLDMIRHIIVYSACVHNCVPNYVPSYVHSYADHSNTEVIDSTDVTVEEANDSTDVQPSVVPDDTASSCGKPLKEEAAQLSTSAWYRL